MTILKNHWISGERLRELLQYDPETGVFTWRMTRRGLIKAGAIAGSVQKSGGYIIMAVDGKRHYAHRLAWLWCYGSFPKGYLDHIDRNPTNNRIANLREATRSQNSSNRIVSKTTRSGLKGVVQARARRGPPRFVDRWIARIGYNGQLIHLGVFSTPEEAAYAYAEAAHRLHGEYARVS